jgi:hypothetical protein
VQPCPTCGAVDVDANGYCVNCRAFRGALGHYEVMPQAPPQGYATAPHGYATPPQGYGAPPISGVPAGSPIRRVPLWLLLVSTGMLVAVSAALVVVLLRGGDGKPPQATAAPAGTTSAPAPSVPPTSLAPVVKAGLDKCLVGTWVATTDYWPLTDDYSVYGTTHSGPVFRFGGDGRMSLEFGSGVSYTGTVKGKKVEVLVTGQVKYDYETVNRVLNMTNPVSDVRMVVTVDGVQQSSQQRTSAPFSWPYTCDGDKLTANPDDPRATPMRRQ